MIIIQIWLPYNTNGIFWQHAADISYVVLGVFEHIVAQRVLKHSLKPVYFRSVEIPYVRPTVRIRLGLWRLWSTIWPVYN